MTPDRLPHRVIVQRIPYVRDATQVAPPGVERLGDDAEGRAVFVQSGRARSRPYVFLAAESLSLVAYVREDPPAGYGLADVLTSAFPDRLARPEALALLGLIAANHVVLADGTRLGGPREALTEAVARVALEPDGLITQAARVPEWALAEALRPRADTLTARLLADRWVRGLGRPELGFVRAVEPRELVISRSSAEPLDIGDTVVVRSRAGNGPPVLVRVEGLEARTVRAVQARADRSEGVSHGDPVELLAQPRRPAGADPE